MGRKRFKVCEHCVHASKDVVSPGDDRRLFLKLTKEFEEGTISRDNLKILADLKHKGYKITNAKVKKEKNISNVIVSIEMVVIRCMGLEQTMTKKEYESHGSIGAIVKEFTKEVKF